MTIPKGKGEGYNELGVVFCKYHYPKLTPSLMAEWLRRLGRHAEADAYERRMQDELDQKRRDEEAKRKAAEVGAVLTARMHGVLPKKQPGERLPRSWPAVRL